MRLRYLAPILAAAVLSPAIAQAAVGYTEGRVALRAGPGPDFPRLEALPRNVRVNVHGCVHRFDWCDVSWRGARGWINGERLTISYRGRRVLMHEYGPRMDVPVISFHFDSYWDNNYSRSGFYRERDRWRHSWRGDEDRDGVPNRYDRDRDGDGTPNRRDDRPDNPYRD